MTDGILQKDVIFLNTYPKKPPYALLHLLAILPFYTVVQYGNRGVYRGLGLDEYLIWIMHMLIVEKTIRGLHICRPIFSAQRLNIFLSWCHRPRSTHTLRFERHLVWLKYPETQNDQNAKNALLRFFCHWIPWNWI